jgi:hypothetical protein
MTDGSNSGDHNQFCQNCGSKIASSNTYCPECGVDDPFDDTAAGGTGDGYDKEEEEDEVSEGLKGISWLAGGFLLFLSLSTFIDPPTGNLTYLIREIIVGTATVTAGLLLLPPVQSRIEPSIGQELPRGTGVVIFVIWFLIFGIVTPPTDGGTGASAEGAENGEAVASATATATASTEPASPYAVRIYYDGWWSGEVEVKRSGQTASESYNVDGSTLIEIDDPVSYITVSAEKEEADDGELVVQILEDGQVVDEVSTTNPYGDVFVEEYFS